MISKGNHVKLEPKKTGKERGHKTECDGGQLLWTFFFPKGREQITKYRQKCCEVMVIRKGVLSQMLYHYDIDFAPLFFRKASHC